MDFFFCRDTLVYAKLIPMGSKSAKALLLNRIVTWLKNNRHNGIWTADHLEKYLVQRPLDHAALGLVILTSWLFLLASRARTTMGCWHSTGFQNSLFWGSFGVRVPLTGGFWMVFLCSYPLWKPSKILPPTPQWYFYNELILWKVFKSIFARKSSHLNMAHH